MISDRLPFSYHESSSLARLSHGKVSVEIAYTERRGNHGTMILDGG